MWKIVKVLGWCLFYLSVCISILTVKHICSQEFENEPHAHTLLHKHACAEVCSNPVSVLVYDPGVMSKPLAGYRLYAGMVRGDQRMSNDIPSLESHFSSVSLFL